MLFQVIAQGFVSDWKMGFFREGLLDSSGRGVAIKLHLCKRTNLLPKLRTNQAS